MSELDDQEEPLSTFLQQNYNLSTKPEGNGLSVDSECSVEDLQKRVSKFIYRQNLNNRYWAAIDHDNVRIRKFEQKKVEKKNKHPTPPSTIKHGW